MSKLIIASNNEGKIKEIKAILSPFFTEIISMKEAGVFIDVEETGATFRENAYLKARAVYEIVKSPVLSDDSGICVDALNGGPGVFSARYAGPGRSDADNNFKLLRELKRLGAATCKQRAAHFACAAVLCQGDGGVDINPSAGRAATAFPESVIVGEGRTYGHILNEPAGENGFGYDCVFFSDDLGMPFGLADPKDKNTVSHRYRALSQIAERLGGIKKRLGQ